MALDGKDTRRSISGVPPIPDGRIDAADRRHIAGFYRRATEWEGPQPTTEGWTEATPSAAEWTEESALAANWLYMRCLAYWKCNDNADDYVVLDSSLLGNNGTSYYKTNQISAVNNDNISLQRWFIDAGGGTSPFLSTIEDVAELDFPDNDFSICFVFKMLHTTLETNFIGKQGSAGRGYKIYSSWDDVKLRVYLQWSADSADSITMTDDTAFDLDTVYWVCVTFDRDGNVSLYVNNVLHKTADMSGVGDLSNGNPLNFGYSLNGYIDNVQIFNKVLSDSERDFLWNGGAFTESLDLQEWTQVGDVSTIWAEV